MSTVTTQGSGLRYGVTVTEFEPLLTGGVAPAEPLTITMRSPGAADAPIVTIAVSETPSASTVMADEVIVESITPSVVIKWRTVMPVRFLPVIVIAVLVPLAMLAGAMLRRYGPVVTERRALDRGAEPLIALPRLTVTGVLETAVDPLIALPRLTETSGPATPRRKSGLPLRTDTNAANSAPMLFGLVTLTAASPNSAGCAVLVARTLTFRLELPVKVAGAVYKPAKEIVPTELLPPWMSLTLQVTL